MIEAATDSIAMAEMTTMILSKENKKYDDSE